MPRFLSLRRPKYQRAAVNPPSPIVDWNPPTREEQERWRQEEAERKRRNNLARRMSEQYRQEEMSKLNQRPISTLDSPNSDNPFNPVNDHLLDSTRAASSSNSPPSSLTANETPMEDQPLQYERRNRSATFDAMLAPSQLTTAEVARNEKPTRSKRLRGTSGAAAAGAAAGASGVGC